MKTSQLGLKSLGLVVLLTLLSWTGYGQSTNYPDHQERPGYDGCLPVAPHYPCYQFDIYVKTDPAHPHAWAFSRQVSD